MRISHVCFFSPVQLPDNSFGQTLTESEHLKITRDGDTLLVVANIPDLEERGFPSQVERHYNWAGVSWCTPAAVATKTAKKTA